jgi:3-dehydroquinate synthase
VIHQPSAVIVDLELLDSLPQREYRAGWAEVIKAGAIRDLRLFRELERRPEECLGREPAALARAIERAVRVKARVVAEDERETGVRRLLNFGHTLGHALEAALGYRRLLHGEAVAIGMAFAARLGEALGETAPGFAARLEALLGAFGLPAAAPRVSKADLLAIMSRDKKRGPRGIRWVLVERPGRAACIDSVPQAIVRRTLERFLKGESLDV